MAEYWQNMTPVAEGDVSSSEEFNKLISNLNLLWRPNSCYAVAEGDEPDWTFVSGTDKLSDTIPHLEASMVWSGKPLLFIYNIAVNGNSTSGDLFIYLRNSYNDERVYLRVNGNGYTDAAIPITVGGMEYVALTNAPSEPTEVEFWLEIEDFVGVGGSSLTIHYAYSPRFLLVEMPL